MENFQKLKKGSQCCQLPFPLAPGGNPSQKGLLLKGSLESVYFTIKKIKAAILKVWSVEKPFSS